MDSSIGSDFPQDHSQCSEIAKTVRVHLSSLRASRGGWWRQGGLSTARNTDRNQESLPLTRVSEAGSWARPDRMSSTEPASHHQWHWFFETRFFGTAPVRGCLQSSIGVVWSGGTV